MNSKFLVLNSRTGFTLLEILVAVAILGIAVTVVLQLFSADLRAIAASDDYVTALTMAEAKMREVLDSDSLSEGSQSEATGDGYRVDVSVSSASGDRTENLQVMLLDVSVTLRWTKGAREKSLTLRTLKAVKKQV